MAKMRDLPPELVEMIFTKIPITSVRTMRSTCKLWDNLSKECILGKATAARQQFSGFMTMNSKVCSIRFNLCRKEKEEEDLLELSIKQVDLLSHVMISKVFQCYGLLLCVTEDNSRLLVWNPYLGQTRWIEPKTNFHRLDRYVIGYDNKNHEHKILRFLDDYMYKDDHHYFAYEIYDFSTNSWRGFDIIPDWEIMPYQRGVSLKGNSYFFAKEKIGDDFDNGAKIGDKIEIFNGETFIIDVDDFLLCFDFTREKFGPRLPLPFHCNLKETATLSCVREEQLAVLYQQIKEEILHIWVTTTIEPNVVSWSKFLRVEMKPFGLAGVRVYEEAGSFFIDEEEKVAVVFDVNKYIPTKTTHHKAFIIGEYGYLKSVSLAKAPKVTKPALFSEYIRKIYCPPLVCSSSYLPSLVQLKQPRKRKERDG